MRKHGHDLRRFLIGIKYEVSREWRVRGLEHESLEDGSEDEPGGELENGSEGGSEDWLGEESLAIARPIHRTRHHLKAMWKDEDPRREFSGRGMTKLSLIVRPWCCVDFKDDDNRLHFFLRRIVASEPTSYTQHMKEPHMLITEDEDFSHKTSRRRSVAGRVMWAG